MAKRKTRSDDQVVRQMEAKLQGQPWLNEPNEAAFEAYGLPCRIRRSKYGNLNGYVGVPKGHLCYGKSYDSEEAMVILVHGGLTYSGNDLDWFSDDERKYWWLGFDTSHSCDFMPGLSFGEPAPEDWRGYRTFKYVRKETRALAKQLAKY